MNAVPFTVPTGLFAQRASACSCLASFSPEEPVAGRDSAARQETLGRSQGNCVLAARLWWDCLEHALANEVEDDLGGLTATERSAANNPRDSGGHTCAAGSRTSKVAATCLGRK